MLSVAVGVAVAAANAAAGEGGEALTATDSATVAHPVQSVLAFPVGFGMPEGRWASACSLACIIPGVNATRTIMDQTFEFGEDVCVAHIDDAVATQGSNEAGPVARVALMDAFVAVNARQNRNKVRWPDPVVTYEPHAAREDTRPHCPTGSRLVDGRAWWPAHPKLLPVAMDDASDMHRQLMVDEALVFGALAMGRNVLRGGVHRKVSVYDVLAVSVQRLGVCITEFCDVVVAVDTTRPSMPITRCANGSETEGSADTKGDSCTSSSGCLTTNVPIITHVGPDGVERPVEMTNLDVLALGRGMLGSPGWFKDAATPFHLGGQLSLRGPAMGAPMESNSGLRATYDREENAAWDLNGTVLENMSPPISGSLLATSTSTPLLAHLATLFCAGSLRSFIASPSACEGIRPWGRIRRTSGSAEIQGNLLDPGVWAGAGRVEWEVTPTILTPAAIEDASRSRAPLPYLRPAWSVGEDPLNTLIQQRWLNSEPLPPELIGRSSREVNPSSAVEAKLAGSLFQRQLVLPADVVAGHSSRRGSCLDMDAAQAVSGLVDRSSMSVELAQELDRISHVYDRRVFQEEHPAPPVSTADLMLAILMVVPELGALLVLLLTTKRWGRAALLGFSTIVTLGAVSLSGVIALALQEAMGATWRARSTRTATHAIFPAGEPLTSGGMPTPVGTLVVVENSFLILAPTMYRPASVHLVAVVVCGAYVVATAAMAMRVLFVARQQRCGRRVDVAGLQPGAARESQLRARQRLRRRARDGTQDADRSSGTRDDSGGDSGAAVEGAWCGSGGIVAFPADGVPPWPEVTGGGSAPPRWGGNGGSEWV